jgi:hypothetical protein
MEESVSHEKKPTKSLLFDEKKSELIPTVSYCFKHLNKT